MNDAKIHQPDQIHSKPEANSTGVPPPMPTTGIAPPPVPDDWNGIPVIMKGTLEEDANPAEGGVQDALYIDDPWLRDQFDQICAVPDFPCQVRMLFKLRKQDEARASELLDILRDEHAGSVYVQLWQMSHDQLRDMAGSYTTGILH